MSNAWMNMSCPIANGTPVVRMHVKNYDIEGILKLGSAKA